MFKLGSCCKKAMVEEMKKKITGYDAEIDSLQDQLKDWESEGIEITEVIFELV